MLPNWLTEELAGVPAYAAFAGADELEYRLRAVADAAGGSARADLRRVGTSRLGAPISCLSIGEGEPNALVFGLPHPNEPVGGLAALHLAERLCADDALRRHLGHRWHIVACIDPDGLRLNEGWLAGPFTRSHYLRHFYRPAGDEQVEWTFPVDHEEAYFDSALPETLALMRLIDQTRPALMGSLHNAEQGGAYFYLTRPEGALHPVLQGLPEAFGIPLDRGEPESPTSPVFADGIFGPLSLAALYDAAVAAGDPLPLGSGDTSDSYASRYGTLTLVSEVPYWSDPRVADLGPADTTYAQALSMQADALDELGEVMTAVLAAVENDLIADSPFLRASRFFAPLMGEAAGTTRRRASEQASARPATVAEAVGVGDVVHSFRLRYGGMLLRMLDGELAVGNVRRSIISQRDTMAPLLDKWHEEAAAADRTEVLPIRSLVATQYGALLAAARHLHAGSPD